MPAASENMSAPVAVTVADPVPEVTVNGPTIASVLAPLAWVGVMARLGAGGAVAGPSEMMWATIAATVAWRGSDVLRT